MDDERKRIEEVKKLIVEYNRVVSELVDLSMIYGDWPLLVKKAQAEYEEDFDKEIIENFRKLGNQK